jgi:hypothetical protein
VAADLVVDASGRNSRLPRWLAAAGRPAAAEVEVDADISYASRIYELPPSVRPRRELTAQKYASKKTRMLGAFSVVLERGAARGAPGLNTLCLRAGHHASLPPMGCVRARWVLGAEWLWVEPIPCLCLQLHFMHALAPRPAGMRCADK